MVGVSIAFVIARNYVEDNCKLFTTLELRILKAGETASDSGKHSPAKTYTLFNKTMKNCEKIKMKNKVKEFQVKLWELMASYGNLWHVKGLKGNISQVMGNYGKFWEVMPSYGNLW